MSLTFDQALAGGESLEFASPIIAMAMKTKQEEAQTALASVIGKVMKSAEQSIRTQAQRHRDYNRAAAAARVEGQKIERAYQYMIETGDPLPLASTCADTKYWVTEWARSQSIDLPEAETWAARIPSDWVPSST